LHPVIGEDVFKDIDGAGVVLFLVVEGLGSEGLVRDVGFEHSPCVWYQVSHFNIWLETNCETWET